MEKAKLEMMMVIPRPPLQIDDEGNVKDADGDPPPPN